MCGITGIIGSQEPDWLTAMNRVQFHRGPDDGGEFRDPENRVSLAMRRLSIVDLSDGHQPMIDPVHKRVVVFNGEIFNAPVLRKELIGHGYRFTTKSSDTEVLLHLFDLEGPRMVRRLNGMFAFVIFDPQTRRLFGARDRCGIKPFYWTQQQGRFAFASEMKSLLELPFISRDVDMQSLHHYLTCQFVPPPRSIVRGINKLPPGSCFEYRLDKGSFDVEQFWHPFTNPVCPLDTSDAAYAGHAEAKGLGQSKDLAVILPRLRGLMRDAVKDWLMSDVPIGCSLSGGLDSTAVVGLMAEVGIKPLRTWTVGFAEVAGEMLDERHLASALAKRFNTEHHEVIVQADSLLDDLEKMVFHLDEPYGGGLPSWFVFREMSKEVKVAMTGTGGDELFGNYGKWRIFSPFSPLSPRQLQLALQRIRAGGFQAFLKAPHGTLYHGYFREGDKQSLLLDYRKSTAHMESTEAFYERLWNASQQKSPRNAAPFIDFQTQLPEEFLLMTDRFSMAWSLEARTPFLDPRLVAFVQGLSPDVRTQPRDLKYLLKAAIGDLLPPQLLASPKRGFVLPTAVWLRGRLKPLVESCLGRSFIESQGIFNSSSIEQIVGPHLNGSADHGWQVWTLLMFQCWWKKCILNQGVWE